MKINKKLWMPIFVTFLLIVTVMGSLCIDKNTDEIKTQNSSNAVLKCALSFTPSDTLDPTIKWTGWYMREAGIYETLFAYNEKMELYPELASGFEQISSNEWKIILKDNIKFHDGSIMNADDVIYSLNRVLSSDRKAEYEFIDSIEKNSENNAVIIKTKHPYAPFIASLTDPITSIVSKNATDLKNKPVGTGPFKFKNYTQSINLQVIKNPDYWNGDVKLSGVDIHFIPDEMTRLFKLESNEVDLVNGLPQSEVAKLQNSADFTVDNTETLRTYFLYINGKKEPFNNVNVRHALNYAINRQQIIDTALEGTGGVVAKSIFPSVMSWSVNDKINDTFYDVNKTKSLLSQAGFKDENNDGFLEYYGQPFELSIKTYTTRPQLKPTAEVIKTQFESIGIKTNVIIQQGEAIVTDMQNGNYDLALYAWGIAPTGDPDHILSKFFESTGTEAQKIGYSNSQVDSWINAGRMEMNETKRKEYYDQVQNQVMQDCPVIYVFYQKSSVGLNNKVGGFKQYPNEFTIITKNLYLKK